jgi:hypothetical protein
MNRRASSLVRCGRVGCDHQGRIRQVELNHLTFLANRLERLAVQVEPKAGGIANLQTESGMPLPPQLLTWLKQVFELTTLINTNLKPGGSKDFGPEHVGGWRGESGRDLFLGCSRR